MSQQLSLILAAIAAVVFLSIATTPCCIAQEPTLYLTPYAGAFDIIRGTRNFVSGLEARFNAPHKYIKPKVGGFLTDKKSHYLYAGFNISIPVYQETFYIMPGIAAGMYHKGSGKNLGGKLQFYSTIEVSHKLANTNHRLGLSFGHISNASIYKKNPGEENLMLTYSIPINF